MRLLIALLFGMSVIAATGSTHAVVDVYVPALPSHWILALVRSEAIASSIYAEIGIDLRFHAVKDLGRLSESLRGNHKIMLVFSERTPPDFQPGAMAFVRPYDASSCLTIFLDRIEPMLGGNPAASAALFGHVLAHEIGHMVQGISRHAEEGVMKAGWSGREITSMSWHRLQFTPIDAKLIHDGLSEYTRAASHHN